MHEIHARRAVESAAPAELEILLNEAEGGVWRFRRDPRITRPSARLGRRSGPGIPILSPEIVLLYKAKRPRAADEADFRKLLPALKAAPRRWLAGAIATCHPGHPWVRRLTGTNSERH